VLFSLNAKSQALLTPAELLHAYQVNDSSVNAMLTQKGYQMQRLQENNGEKTNTWYFQVRQDDFTDFNLLKITSAQKTAIRYWIMNPFFFKQFMDTLVNENYKFTEFRIIDKEYYFVFKNGDKQLLVGQKKVTGKEDDYFEIMIN
jgi:hypothetical protein